MLEGLYYALLAMVVSLALSLTLGPLIGTGCANVFWFFTYRLSQFAAGGAAAGVYPAGLAIPLVTYRGAQSRAWSNGCARRSEHIRGRGGLSHKKQAPKPWFRGLLLFAAYLNILSVPCSLR